MIGPSQKSRVRILNSSSCGSGSICGVQGGKSLIMTNAHVAGSRVGRVVQVDVPETSERIEARVIMAAYSDKTLSDWAVLETVENWTGVAPVQLSKTVPTFSNSHYTRGYPRCKTHDGTDIKTVDIADNSPLWRWQPNAIGGQSGSGVWSDDNNQQYGLLTWSWGGYGAGQMTAWIYRQAREKTTAGFERIDGLTELIDEPFDMSGFDLAKCSDPIVENGFFSEAGIVDLPIWVEDDGPINTPDGRPKGFSSDNFVEYCRDVEELHEKWRKRFEETQSGGLGSASGPTFGL